jgi:tetratricopeptide (TPR) repeat protein
VGDFLKGLLDKAPDIISKAAESPLGLASLIVLVLGIVGAFLFRNVAGKLKLAAFAMITSGLLGLFIFASNPKPPSSLPLPDNNSPEKTALENQAAVKLADANRLYMAGQNDQARAAYDEAIGLYKQVDDRLGQANVLRGLGDLESILGRNDQARAAYGEAIGLFKQVDNRLGQANVLRGLGDLDSRKNLKKPHAISSKLPNYTR